MLVMMDPGGMCQIFAPLGQKFNMVEEMFGAPIVAVDDNLAEDGFVSQHLQFSGVGVRGAHIPNIVQDIVCDIYEDMGQFFAELFSIQKHERFRMLPPHYTRKRDMPNAPRGHAMGKLKQEQIARGEKSRF